MDWVLGLILLCAVLIGMLGVGEIVVFFVLGVYSKAFWMIAMAQAVIASILAICFAISFVYILIINK